jgi:hypothetical protein
MFNYVARVVVTHIHNELIVKLDKVKENEADAKHVSLTPTGSCVIIVTMCASFITDASQAVA